MRKIASLALAAVAAVLIGLTASSAYADEVEPTPDPPKVTSPSPTATVFSLNDTHWGG
ncbi:hypothetical protein F4556_002334 [Kitasatospora gansuensis]|uniref:Uncharacterized protein n=1 Tax=Kitasatospora gansuensis TaxID=258050 RepID=A0A7W7WHS0_9ACTN|nr:hypothetical protein [Kitasatospora gansuensis]MBB4946799.1 hypothetical protein [Kitasatospora gansuensis]